MKTQAFKLGDLFTAAELERATKIAAGTDERRLVSELEREIVTPAIDRINRVTGHQNDARYFAYLLAFALTDTRADMGKPDARHASN